MITSHALSQMGFSRTECSNILQRVQKLGVPSKQIMTRFKYKRTKNGITSICDYMGTVNAFPLPDVLSALNAYSANHKDSRVRSVWKGIIEQISHFARVR